MALAAVFLNSFFLDIQKKYSVSYVRYNFGKIKGSGHLLISVLLTLFVEIYLVFRLIQNFNYFIPYIQTVILIAGFIYMICIINKIFIIFSMVLRIKIDNLKYILFNKTITRPILFVLFILCLSLWWIKNG